MNDNREVILEVRNLKQYFKINGGTVIKSVDDVSFKIFKGEIFGLVGESGSGKTTTGRSIIKLYEPTAGEVYYKGERITVGPQTIEEWGTKVSLLINELKKKKAKGENTQVLENEINNLKQQISQAKKDNIVKPSLRQSMQMIFQDPMGSLNPRMRVIDIIAEGLDVHKLADLTKEELKTRKTVLHNLNKELKQLKIELKTATDKDLINEKIKSLNEEVKYVKYFYSKSRKREEKVMKILELVGLSADHAGRYPHEFSGGQRQRIGIARALITNPDFVIADEPISALDVSIQAQVVNLMNDLKKQLGLTYLFIAHDLSMVKYISDRIGVMHQGRLVELGTSNDIYNHAVHPYTRSLLSAIPLPDPDYERERRRIHYNKDEVDYDNGKWIEVAPNHFVLGTKEEIAKWCQII